ncbi:MAG: hypothetical protein JXR30_03205 [Alphaproteobacteria bacterium]|nr:hypothetical protein [Alphaproteobacteria bacterium]
MDLEILNPSGIEVRPNMCYEKRAIEIYGLIQQLTYIISGFFILMVGYRFLTGKEQTPFRTVLFLVFGLGMFTAFPHIMALFTGYDFREIKCESYIINPEDLRNEVKRNEKLLEVIKNKEPIELDLKRERIETIWQRERALQKTNKTTAE